MNGTSWKMLWIITVLSFVALQFWSDRRSRAQGPGTLQYLDVQGVVLRDRSGSAKARLEVSPQGSPSLTFFDTAAHKRLEVSISCSDTPSIILLDAKENVRVGLSLKNDGTALVYANGSRGQNSYELSVLPDNTVQQFFFDQDGSQRLRLLVRPQGRSELCLCSSGGLPGVWMMASPEGDVRQSFFDRGEKERLLLNLDRGGQTITFNGPDSQRRMTSGLLDDGTALQALYDRRGQRRAGIYVSASGLTSEAHFGSDGKRRIELASGDNRPPSFRLFHSDGLPSIGVAVGSDGEPYYFAREKGAPIPEFTAVGTGKSNSIESFGGDSSTGTGPEEFAGSP
jgi:hypothetical protein